MTSSSGLLCESRLGVQGRPHHLQLDLRRPNSSSGLQHPSPRYACQQPPQPGCVPDDSSGCLHGYPVLLRATTPSHAVLTSCPYGRHAFGTSKNSQGTDGIRNGGADGGPPPCAPNEPLAWRLAPRCGARTRRGLRAFAKSSGPALRPVHTRSHSRHAGAKCSDTPDARLCSRNRIAPLHSWRQPLMPVPTWSMQSKHASPS
jgi:hypothetical protein